MTLAALFTLHGSDKDTYHSYGEVYEDLLGPRRDGITAFLEVGVAGGGSLKAWREWLPPDAVVVGLDLDARPTPVDGVTMLLGVDSTDPAACDTALGYSRFDVIVDDGCHWPDEQVETWLALYRRVRPGGLYVIEDLQNVERDGPRFAGLGAELIDRRGVKGRGDDALAVWRKPDPPETDLMEGD